ncbi:MAG TPA: ATP-binding protein [Gemmatimonadales bacterium]|jgi:two-component system NtrC family sensor kinase
MPQESPGTQPSRSKAAASHPGLSLLSEVTATLSAGVFSESAMEEVARLLRRGLSAALCRLWVRVEETRTYKAFCDLTDEPSEQVVAKMSEAIRNGTAEQVPESWESLDLRVPVNHEGERLGLIEICVARDGRETMARDVLSVIANILSPLIASKELSKDLAFEVARRAREIEEQRRFTTKVIDSLPVGLYVIDRHYRVQAWNRKRETGTQGVPREQALGRPIFDVLHRQPRDLLRREFDEVFASGRIQVYESLGEDGRQYRITKIPMRQDDREISHLITIGEDITEWKDVQGQIAQSEKLAAIGQLAAGIMHEINNPLATIGACVDAVSGRAEDLGPEVRAAVDEYLTIMDSEVERCKRIVNNLLDLSRPREAAKISQDVNEVVDETLLLLKHHDRFKGLVLERDLAEDLPKVIAAKDQLIQVFMALMLNAADAMDARGTLRVTTGRNPARNDEVLIALSDSGSGISKGDLQKIFEPFYTTKPQGRGTGLGLSIVYTIVAEHRGRIEVDSTLGRGSTFTVYLPTRAA